MNVSYRPGMPVTPYFGKLSFKKVVTSAGFATGVALGGAGLTTVWDFSGFFEPREFRSSKPICGQERWESWAP